MEIWELSITLKNDFHTMGDVKGSSVSVLKDVKGLVIPATHIKGVLRSEAERMARAKDDRMLMKRIVKLFGPGEQEGGSAYVNPKLKFYDAHANVRRLSMRPHLKIDLETGAKFQAKSKGTLHFQATVPAGTAFVGFVVAKGSGLTPDEIALLKGAAVSASHYGLGGGRSRGLGGVSVNMEKISLERFKEVVF